MTVFYDRTPVRVTDRTLAIDESRYSVRDI
jgi:hypothetical protein